MGTVRAVGGGLALAFVLATAPSAGALQAPTCLEERATIVGTPGNDVLTGTANDDVIVGLQGDDTINAGDGIDIVCGGEGNDVIVGGEGLFDVISGDLGDDRIDGGGGIIDIAMYADAPAGVNVDLKVGAAVGGGGNDSLTAVNGVFGSDFGDTLRGDAKTNVLNSGPGNDFVFGGGAGDVLTGWSGNDYVDGGSGVDDVDFNEAPRGVRANLATRKAVGWGTDRLVRIENLEGSAHADVLTGDGRRNVLRGLAGNDVIAGGAGPDSLDGGRGRDRVDGGLGRDVCKGERKRRCP